jgi:hypothetical protein
MPVGHVGAHRGAGDLAGGADFVEEIEHDERRLAVVLAPKTPHRLDVDADETGF